MDAKKAQQLQEMTDTFEALVEDIRQFAGTNDRRIIIGIAVLEGAMYSLLDVLKHE